MREGVRGRLKEGVKEGVRGCVVRPYFSAQPLQQLCEWRGRMCERGCGRMCERGCGRMCERGCVCEDV